MDELLQRLVEVDRLADEKIRQATAEAERLTEECRQRLAQEDKQFDEKLADECSQLQQEELKEKQRQREQTLAEADTKIHSDLQDFAQRCAKQRGVVLKTLLYAETVQAADKDKTGNS